MLFIKESSFAIRLAVSENLLVFKRVYWPMLVTLNDSNDRLITYMYNRPCAMTGVL